MSSPNFVILYASDVPRSAAFWEEELGFAPAEASPGFAMFVGADGARLGLWRTAAVQPAVDAAAGGTELCLPCADRAAVDAAYAAALARGRVVLQPPTAMDFGYTFTLSDPDGHRLRRMSPSA